MASYPDPHTNKAAYEKGTELRYVSDDRPLETINIRVKGKYSFLAFHNIPVEVDVLSLGFKRLGPLVSRGFVYSMQLNF